MKNVLGCFETTHFQEKLPFLFFGKFLENLGYFVFGIWSHWMQSTAPAHC